MTNEYPPPYPEGPGRQPGQPYGYGPPQYAPPPESYLIWGILTTIFCCLPLGVVSIVKANQVNGLWYQGFHNEARKAADEAKKWAMWSAISLGILVALYVIFFVVVFLILGTSISHLTP